MGKPTFWPTNPYPESVFPMAEDEYCEAVPDPDTRTAISGFLGRHFWDIASEKMLEMATAEINKVACQRDQAQLERDVAQMEADRYRAGHVRAIVVRDEANDKITQLHDACREALVICDNCVGRGITADKLQDVLRQALGEETE